MFNSTAVNSGASVDVGTGNINLFSVNVLANLTSTVTFRSNPTGTTYFVLPANTVADTYYFSGQMPKGLTLVSASASDYGLVLANVSQ